uniref:Uncharacterized protein n=1 Tax=Sphaeramia orbicularis TaxID=375764 RepID=A0A673CF38_9TELE
MGLWGPVLHFHANTEALSLLSNVAKNHRAVLTKHEIVLDYLFAAEGGMCAALNLTGSQCCVLAPDPYDNITKQVSTWKRPADGVTAGQIEIFTSIHE